MAKRCFEPPNFCYQKHQQAKYWAKQKEKEVKPKKKINPVSKNRLEALKKYRKLRDKYFEEHPICEFPGCNSRDIDLHHKRGRYGALLTDKRYFCSLCRTHHIYVETHPKEAKRLGLSLNRV